MPVDVDELARIGSGKPATKATPQKTVSRPQSNIETVDDLANIGSGKEVKKKVVSENGTTDNSNDQSTTNLTDEAQADLGITLGDNTQQPKSNVVAAQVQFANLPKPKTNQEKLVDAGKSIVAKQEATKKSIDIFNQSYGTSFDPNEILSDADKTADFLNTYKKSVTKADFDINSKLQPQNIIASSESFGQPSRVITPTVLPNVDLLTKAKENQELLTNQVVDLSIGEGKLKRIPKNQVINNLYKRLDPKGYERIKQAIDDRTDISTIDFLTGNNPLTKENTKEFELLNTEKAPYEFAYNESLKRQANDMQVMGTLNNDKALIDGAKSIAAQVQSDDDIYAQYPSLNKSRIAADISKEIASKTGQLKGSDAEGVANILNKFRGQSDPFNTDAFKKYYDNPSTRDAALQVASDPDAYLSDASFFGGIKENIWKPVKEIGLSTLSMVGLRDRVDRLADAKNEELFPEVTPQLKGYVSKIKGGLNTTANLLGYMGIQAATGGVASGLGLGVKAAERVGTTMAFGMTGYDTNLKDGDTFLDNEAVKIAYATVGSMLNSVGGEFLELGKISKFKELQKPLVELAEKMTDKNVTEGVVNELLNKAKDPYINALMKYGANVSKGAAVMSYFTFANGVNKMLFGGGGTTEDLVKQTGSAYIDGLMGMSILGAFGAHADLKNEKNTSWKQSFANIANNSDATRDVIEHAYKTKQYTRPEYNEKVQILNTAIAAKNNLAIAEAGNNVTLDEGQKAVYITNRTAEGVIKKQLDNPLLTEQQKGTYEAQVKRLQTQREDILKGLTFNDNLEPLDAVFKAQLEYKKAYEDFNEGVVENDSQVLVAKENLEKAIADNGKTTEPIKPTSETTTEQTAETHKNDMAGLSHADWFLKNKDKFTEDDFNRINTELSSTNEAIKQNAVNEIIAKKDEVKKQPNETIEQANTENEPSGIKTEETKPTETIVAENIQPTEKEAVAATTQSSTVKSEVKNFPKPERDISEMTADEINDYSATVKKHYKDQEVEFFGEEGAKKYRTARSTSNSEYASRDAVKAADAVLKEMEDSLTKEQSDAFFGVDEKDSKYIYDAEELRHIARTVRTVEESENLHELSRALKIPLLDFAKNPKDEGNLAAINAAKRKAQELGVDPKELIEKSVNNIVKDLADENDREFLATTIIKSIFKPTEKQNAPELPRSENKPIQNEQSKVDIKTLEQERDQKIKEISKPELTLDLLSGKELRSIKGDSEFLEAKKIKHDDIEERFNSLQKIVECLWK